MDIWGEIYKDHWRGDPHPHVYIRDDGVRNEVPNAAGYFSAPRTDQEARALDALTGRILDIGCGPGAYALYLENRGHDVVAVDTSPGAIDVCMARGCTDARVMDLAHLVLEGPSFDAIICMGNTIGIGQTPSTLPELLTSLHEYVAPTGCLVVGLSDPLRTSVENRLKYHAQNLARGLPPGLVRTRIAYRGEVGDEWLLWLPTESEFRSAAESAGWVVAEVHRDDARLLCVLRSADTAP